jgi:hypothetical protein
MPFFIIKPSSASFRKENRTKASRFKLYVNQLIVFNKVRKLFSGLAGQKKRQSLKDYRSRRLLHEKIPVCHYLEGNKLKHFQNLPARVVWMG